MRKLILIAALLQFLWGDQYPVTVPSGATVTSGIEQLTGWTGDSTASVSGAYAPAICELNPTGNGNPCPGAGTTAGGTYTGGGGGSTLDVITTGIPTNYSGWMAKFASSVTCGQKHMRLEGTFNFSGTLTEIQAIEFGRRMANCAGITDNGQMQLVPIGGGLLELDYVPSSSGGWSDTGCRYPMFVTSTLYTWDIYYVNDFNGALSIPYVSINGTVCRLAPSTQHVAGANLGWTANAFVIGIQPDAKPTASAASYTARVTVKTSVWQ